MRILDLHEQFCQYCLAIKNYRHSTIHNYKGTIKLLVKQSGIENIEEMTENILRNFFFVGRTERNWTSITFIDYRKSMMGFFKWCVKQKIIATNPLENIEKPKLEKRLPKNLCIESARRLLEVTLNYPYTHDFIRYRNYAVIATFVYSGLRANELLKLSLTDVDFQNKLITVRQGKGAKDRMVPMLTDLEIILQKYLSQRQLLDKTCPEFFASFNRNMGFTYNGLKRLVDLICKTSQIRFHCHMLRHTFATLMLQGGCDIFNLSKMMGHSDIKLRLFI